ncbi:DUF305 domain-containing protein [Trinickia caryophylli]|uniref:Uncharacterized conserved protein, DUF305 family n=1 Tax=Trinickia caryophylli TaxID=28094 RepID=A0A1X7FRE5_TRICW|nr:DUF305 domain-containing protein [Trinickia caryophylli]PMS11991.1 DUF305 domain-containing protein [Trinickia caryophylli]TRX15337.1 DUF305 domain-containing protein [Trinickia caryophylli]WQE15683.1 DUF305 domain-containing protein [Trinickia caryophylli]SMF57385.1 Uncharacterized conserved protein, DUF305 family [Trinickia caryophylli]GLU33726.1 hypothetical protein Busp01_35680 [Trinickia caryophylli]
MNDSMRRVRRLGLLCLAVSAVCIGAARAAGPGAADEAAFLAENDRAMTRMMDGMSIKPGGDVDRDFVAMMVAHHQGAIDMAQSELRHGRNEQLRRIAQEIIVEQQQEIVAMRLALGEPLPAPAPAPDQPQPGSSAQDGGHEAHVAQATQGSHAMHGVAAMPHHHTSSTSTNSTMKESE